MAVVVHLIETGKVDQSLAILRSDTRMELTPLDAAAEIIMGKIRERGFRAETVLPKMDDRFFVYMFGRGVPPPFNTFRWCTGATKNRADAGGAEKSFAINVRREADRDYRGCGSVRALQRVRGYRFRAARMEAECGQGWFQEATPEAIADTLAPLLHWRVCFVWDWLFSWRRA